MDRGLGQLSTAFGEKRRRRDEATGAMS